MCARNTNTERETNAACEKHDDEMRPLTVVYFRPNSQCVQNSHATKATPHLEPNKHRTSNKQTPDKQQNRNTRDKSAVTPDRNAPIQMGSTDRDAHGGVDMLTIVARNGLTTAIESKELT